MQTVTPADVKREPSINQSPAAFISFKYVARELYLILRTVSLWGLQMRFLIIRDIDRDA